MSKVDDRILEYIYENRTGSPTELANNDYIRVSKQYISRRLRELADHDLLEPAGNGVYLLSKKGRYYLAGAYDAQAEKFIEEELRNYEWLILVSEEKIVKRIEKIRKRVGNSSLFHE